MLVRDRAANSLNFAHPELSLLRVTLQIIEHPLFVPVQTHWRNVREANAKTTANPG